MYSINSQNIGEQKVLPFCVKLYPYSESRNRENHISSSWCVHLCGRSLPLQVATQTEIWLMFSKGDWLSLMHMAEQWRTKLWSKIPMNSQIATKIYWWGVHRTIFRDAPEAKFYWGARFRSQYLEIHWLWRLNREVTVSLVLWRK